MSNLYHVYLYRELRLSFPDIKASSAQAAAEAARQLPTEDAVSIEDCDGDNLGALVDQHGDADYSQSVMVDFEGERMRKAAPKLLMSLRQAVVAIRDIIAGAKDGSAYVTLELANLLANQCDLAEAALMEARAG